jgi:hypothetical protein
MPDPSFAGPISVRYALLTSGASLPRQAAAGSAPTVQPGTPRSSPLMPSPYAIGAAHVTGGCILDPSAA